MEEAGIEIPLKTIVVQEETTPAMSAYAVAVHPAGALAAVYVISPGPYDPEPEEEPEEEPEPEPYDLVAAAMEELATETGLAEAVLDLAFVDEDVILVLAFLLMALVTLALAEETMAGAIVLLDF